MPKLSEQHCQRDVTRLDSTEATRLLTELDSDWNIQDDTLTRIFTQSNYYETLAFINAAAQVAHRQDHHPDISFGYKQCEITYSTHSVGGLSLNDFICAAKIDVVAKL